MADNKKISELNEITSTSGSSLLYVVDDLVGKKITINSMLENRVPVYPFVPPVLSDFTWINQETATADDTYNGIYILAPASSGDKVRLLKKTAPSVPYIITAWFLLHLHGVDFNNVGLSFRQSSDGKMCNFVYVHSDSYFSIDSNKFNSPTSFNASYLKLKILHTSLICLRIEDNNTNRICSWSTDGYHFHTFHSIGRTDFLTADEVGFLANSVNSTYPAGATLLSWEES